MRSACWHSRFQSLQFRAQFVRLGGSCRRGRPGESDDQAEEHGTGLRCPSDTPGCKAWNVVHAPNTRQPGAIALATFR